MTAKTIRITEEAYRRLAREKRGGESLSQVIVRIFPDSSAKDLVGILDLMSPNESKRFKRAVDGVRRGLDQDLKNSLKAMRRR